MTSVRRMYVTGYDVSADKVKLRQASDDLTIKLKTIKHTKICKPEILGVYPSSFAILDERFYLPIIPPFMANRQSLSNQVAAVVHRVGCAMPEPKWDRIADFKRYAEEWIKCHFTPLDPEDVPSFDEWLNQTPYSGSRKEYLREVKASIHDLKDVYAECKSFVKWESYPEMKAPRAINSPSDESKVLLGPLMHAVDKKTFASGWFVKGTNPRDWPDMLCELFRGRHVCETDFSSFEAHHLVHYENIIRFWVMHMIRHCGLTNNFKRLVSRLMMGTNIMNFSKLVATIPQRLMSGAMWTSSANGVLNLLLMSYTILRSVDSTSSPEQLAKTMPENFIGRVEGDDGIFACDCLNMKIIEELGLLLKPELHEKFTDAKFCGIICDEENHRVVTDPRRFLQKFCLCPANYVDSKETKLMSLLRAKALSYACNFNDCPIIGEVCHKVLDITRSYDIQPVLSEMDGLKRSYIQTSLTEKIWLKKPVISSSSRLVVEKRFGISVSMQMDIEARVHVSNGLCLLSGELLTPLEATSHGIETISTCKEFVIPQVELAKDIVEIMKHGKNISNRKNQSLTIARVHDKLLRNCDPIC